MLPAAVLFLSLLAPCFASPAHAAAPPSRAADATASARATPAADPAHRYAERADVRAFIREVADETGMDRHALARWFADARFQPRIVAAMDRPIAEPP